MPSQTILSQPCPNGHLKYAAAFQGRFFGGSGISTNSKLPGFAASTDATIFAAYSLTMGQMFEPRTTSAIARFAKSCWVLDILISRNHHGETGKLGFGEEHSVLNLGPTHLRRCRHVVVRKNAPYAGWNIVVEKNPH
jgi:hypothetical protein